MLMDQTTGIALKDPGDLFPGATQLPDPGVVVASGRLELSNGSVIEITPRLSRMLDQIVDGIRARKVVHVEFDDALVTPQRAGEMLGVSRPTIYSWQDAGLLPTVRQGSRRLVPIESVLDRLHGSTSVESVLEEVRRDRHGSDSADAVAPDWVSPSSPVAIAFRELDAAVASHDQRG